MIYDNQDENFGRSTKPEALNEFFFRHSMVVYLGDDFFASVWFDFWDICKTSSRDRFARR